MFKSKEDFKKRYREQCMSEFADEPNILKPVEQYLSLASLFSEEIRKIWTVSRNKRRMDKKIYYFSSEFLIGHTLTQNIKSFKMEEIVREGLKDINIDYDFLIKQEKDAGLGNGGLGRLAACFMDSMTALGISAKGHSIRYNHGFFTQVIENFEQKEVADDWLKNGYPWETKHPGKAVIVKFGGHVDIEYINERLYFNHEDYWAVRAMPYDVSIMSYDNKEHVNALRLWDAEPIDRFDFVSFNSGDYFKAFECEIEAQKLTQLLYPADNHPQGRKLRLMQEYFFVSAGINSIVEEYMEYHDSIDGIEDNVAVHINDTHPALCVPELMRIFVDEYDILWDKAWDMTTKIVSYTNHTILPEALETWSCDLMREVQPRIYMIIDEINRRFTDAMMERDDFDHNRMHTVSIIKDNTIHMAALSMVGSHSINGVAALHTEILKTRVMKPYYELFPERFNNKTNGISHRTFLLNANHKLSDLISSSIGEKWIKNPYELKELLKYKEDAAFREEFAKIKYENKIELSDLIYDVTSYKVDPNSIFDIQVKRIHAYKRQLLNILAIMYRCNQDPEYIKNMEPHTFIFAGKSAPSYTYAKSIIRLCNRLAQRINNDPVLSQKIKVIFIPNFNVSIAQKIYPAADISQQISTAGMEASGTGNMKFMMNGAVTLGTLDGANVEIFELVGDENINIFGMTVEEVAELRHNGYDPWNVLDKDPVLRKTVNQLRVGFFGGGMEQFSDIYESLMKYGDSYFVLQDFKSYFDMCKKCEADYTNKDFFRKVQIHNIAMSGHFSSDRTIREYVDDIWKVKINL
ncbi:MAG: glycogen/starch/alpha-glucan phosphorylase [Eubacteriales bacterium]